MRRAIPITLSDEEWSSLRRWIVDRKVPARIRLRARILLGAAVGRSNREIARSLGLDPATVSFWRRRFETQRLEGGLEDAPRPGRRSLRTAEVSQRVLNSTYLEPPPHGTRWTTRSLAGHLGVNHMLVHRVWKANGVGFPGAPGHAEAHRAVPSNPRVELLGVLLQPPRRAVIFGVGRAEPASPPGQDGTAPLMNPGISGGFLFRTGASDGDELLTILDRMEAFVGHADAVGYERHDILALLRELEERARAAEQLHVFVENPGESDGGHLAAWLERRPKYVLHGFPSGSEWRDGLRAFVLQHSDGSGTEAALFGVPMFATAAARFAAGSSLGGPGLLWSISGPLPSPGDVSGPGET
jgi:transposase